MFYVLQVYALIGVSVAIAVFLGYFLVLAAAFLLTGTHRRLKRLKSPHRQSQARAETRQDLRPAA